MLEAFGHIHASLIERISGLIYAIPQLTNAISNSNSLFLVHGYKAPTLNNRICFNCTNNTEYNIRNQ